MNAPMTAIELTGTVDHDHQLHLDTSLPITGPQRVRVIVLYPLADGEHGMRKVVAPREGTTVAGTPAQILSAITALAVPVAPESTSENHDQILYGREGAQ